MGVVRESGVIRILSSSVCKEEIMECDEHEIVAKICSLLGEKPCDMCKAEEIFNEMKYEITRYIISHEFCHCSKTEGREDLLIWLDEKTSPAGIRQLVDVIEKYLK